MVLKIKNKSCFYLLKASSAVLYKMSISKNLGKGSFEIKKNKCEFSHLWSWPLQPPSPQKKGRFFYIHSTCCPFMPIIWHGPTPTTHMKIVYCIFASIRTCKKRKKKGKMRKNGKAPRHHPKCENSHFFLSLFRMNNEPFPYRRNFMLFWGKMTNYCHNLSIIHW